MEIIEYNLKIKHGDEIVELSSATTEPEVDDTYAPDGFSVEMRHGVCVASKEYDEFLYDKLTNGDQFEKDVAANATRWFCVFLPTRDYMPQDLELIKANYMNGFTFTMSNQLMLNDFMVEPEHPIEGIATPVRYFDRFNVWKYLVEGLKYNFNNRVKYERNAANPQYPRPIPGSTGR